VISKKLEESLKKQQYALIGSHSAVKICTWTKKSIQDKDDCYKSKFYGIRSYLCCQMSPCLGCANLCIFCWRDQHTPKLVRWRGRADPPELIIDGAIREQKRLLSGIAGGPRFNREKWQQAKEPMHFALSLVGEPILYPKINQLIRLLHKQGKTTFVVCNGVFPEILRKLEPPTQLYLSLDAPDEELWNKIDKPVMKDGWKRLVKSLKILKELKKKTRTCIRITLIKEINDVDPEGYAKLLAIADPHFVEIKAYMFVGSSRQRLSITNMPYHEYVVEFAKKICAASKYKIIDEKRESRVVLLMKRDFKGRIMKF
jgi:tRNA wybutosine-synthesizing protein 1